MANITLNSEDYDALARLVAQSKDANQLRRALSILSYADGQSVPNIAKLLRVSETVIYKWINLFLEREELSIEDRLAELPRGRPRKVREAENVETAPHETKDIELLIVQIIMRSPKEFGYLADFWTLDSLTMHLQRKKAIEISRLEVKSIFDKIMHEGIYDISKNYLR